MERRKLERAVYISGVTLINTFAFVLIAIVGLTMLLVGLAFWLEPAMGSGPAFALIGGLALIAALAGGYMVHRLVLHPDNQQQPPT